MNEAQILNVGADPQISPENSGPMRASAPTEKERTPEMIGAEIRMYVDAGRRITLLCGIEIGRRLVEAKEMLNHGEWLPWLKRETEFSERSAQNYMKVFNEYGAAQLGLFGPETNTQTFADLPISKALAMLSLPESERESFAEEVGAESLSVRELEEKVKERTAELEEKARNWEDKAGEYASTINDLQNDLEDTMAERDREEKARADAEEQLRKIRKELEEIENRPQAVAYERDELAIAEAVQAERERLEREQAGAIAKAANDAADAEREKHAAAEKDYKKNIQELKDQIKKAEAEKAETGKRLEELTKKAAEAEKSGRETAGLERQIDTLKKQLALAAPSVADFKAAFDRAQDELVHMERALREVQDEEIKEKLKKASLAMLAGFQERVSE